ncbi:hypothetical protein LY90DRAFT_501211 [Neocallimastix californiae]|uniref:Uncharacterized protein n=1 Tax=Neocallimastix californiae TaxID=1754190 RepID=A0A1Y2F337_9FUNG|nr:hypothetical protein LY90DRAFT_501211 [Neocallimastix californiae]|eukprot:ORY77894.1 hypothetical protein LY90DRAFT_501211 [Neocallimastix californiae]
MKPKTNFIKIFLFIQIICLPIIAYTFPSQSLYLLSNKLRSYIKTFKKVSNNFLEILKEKDTSFYDKKYHNYPYLSGFEFAARLYTKDTKNSGLINSNLMTDIKSWIYCLHEPLTSSYSLYDYYKVDENTVVYRGIKRKIPKDWYVGERLYFAGFTSTSLDSKIAENFKKGIFDTSYNDKYSESLLIITIKNNGIDDNSQYCKNIHEISQYKYEKEILITAFSLFEITKIDRKNKIAYLDCLGIDYCKNSVSAYKASISSNLDDGEIEICDYDIIDIDNDDEILDDNETTDYM